MRLLFCVTVVALLTAGVAVAQETQKHATDKPVTVVFKNAEGQNVGTATLTEAPHGVNIKLDITNLPPGEHSLHIHQVAKCDPPDFKSAGPHFDAWGNGACRARPWGDASGGHSEFFVVCRQGRDGATLRWSLPNVTMDEGDHSVFSNGGTAIVIHAVSTGTGDAAPARIACGVIKK